MPSARADGKAIRFKSLSSKSYFSALALFHGVYFLGEAADYSV